MRNIRLSCVLIVATLMFMLGGCGKSPSLVPNNPPSDGKGIVKLTIQWDGFGAKKAAIASVSNPEITHVGARLEYPAENAVFSQSVSKTTAEEVGIITMEVPPSANANLYVAAVEKGNSTYGSNLVHWFGVVRNMNIVANTTLNIKMTDIDWIPATWVVDESYQADYQNGVLLAPVDAVRTTFAVRVRDPFQIGSDTSLIGMHGVTMIGTNTDGWRSYNIVCQNPTPGIPNTSRCLPQYGYPSFYPYLRYEPFNLPAAQYAIPPLAVDLQVRWE